MVRWKSKAVSKDALHRIKREAVIQEAGLAFRRKGYHNTSLDEVARSLNITKAALYNYVKDKQEILFECHRVGLDLGEAALADAGRAGGPASRRLHVYIQRYVELLTTEMGGSGMLTEIDALTAEQRHEVVTRRDSVEARLVAIVAEGIADGSVRRTDPRIAVYTFMGAINWIPRWFLADGRLSGSEIAAEVASNLVGGLMEPAGAAAQSGDPGPVSDGPARLPRLVRSTDAARRRPGKARQDTA